MNTAGAWPGTMAAIAIGAVLGAWARWGLGLWLNRPDAAVPGGTLTANLIGGLLIGMFLALADRRPEWAAQCAAPLRVSRSQRDRLPLLALSAAGPNARAVCALYRNRGPRALR